MLRAVVRGHTMQEPRPETMPQLGQQGSCDERHHEEARNNSDPCVERCYPANLDTSDWGMVRHIFLFVRA